MMSKVPHLSEVCFKLEMNHLQAMGGTPDAPQSPPEQSGDNSKTPQVVHHKSFPPVHTWNFFIS